jgi:hypothetical protein
MERSRPRTARLRPIEPAGNGLGTTDSLDAAVPAPAPVLEFDRTPGSTIFTAEGFRFRLNGLSGIGPVVIYGSTNLLDWSPLFTNPPTAGSLEFLDPSAITNRLRFYRAGE